jgi:hypothetical protein
MIIIKGKIGTAPIGNGNLDTIRGRGLRLVKNPNMDYTFLYTRNLFRDIMIVRVVNVRRVGIQTGDHHYNGAGIDWLSYASNFHRCDFAYLIIELRKFREMIGLLRIGSVIPYLCNNGLGIHILIANY